MRGDLRRKKGTRKEKRAVLVITEGIQTEPDYFRRLSRHLKATGVQVRPSRIKGVGRDPLSVVTEAINIRADQQKDQEFDEAWAVVDVDDHAKLKEAIAVAKANKIGIAISNPCFEVWLVWHFEDLTGYRTASQLRAALKRNGVLGKALPDSFPVGAVKDASARSSKSMTGVASHTMGPNPSSAIHELVALLES